MCPILTNDVLFESLKMTNAYCLQGITDFNTSKYGEGKNFNIFPGLKSVVEVFEEVLLWPMKFPDIFNQSPLRNQAGILLYGAPGTGDNLIIFSILFCGSILFSPTLTLELSKNRWRLSAQLVLFNTIEGKHSCRLWKTNCNRTKC